MKKRFLFIFLSIFILAAVLRLYKLNEIPPGVNRDEASIGYTAYSLLKTGRDEYGRLFPLSFQSFGDWKLPFYIYTTVPFVSVLGLSELAVRLPSALFGIATVGLTFFLVRQLFNNQTLSFLTMFLLAISPWHIHLSRVESESNTAVFFITLAVFLFLKSIKGRPWLIILSSLAFALTYYIYVGNYIFTTLLLFGILIFYRSEIPRTKLTYTAVFLFIIFFGFIASQTVFSANKTKLSGSGIFGDPAVVHAKIEIPRNEHPEQKSILIKIFHNRPIFGIEKFIQNYFNSFSSQFLFIRGGENKAHNISNFGNMYLIEAPFLFLGIVWLLTIKKTRGYKLLIWWVLIAPVAASLTKDAPHTNRMFAIFPMLPLLTALGIQVFLATIKSYKRYKNILLGFTIFLFIGNVSLYLDRYYIHFPLEDAKYWGIGYKRLNEFLSNSANRSKQVAITRPEHSPYIYLLFYSKYDPKKYQKEAKRYPPTKDGFVHVRQFGRFEFRNIDWKKDFKLKSSITRINSQKERMIPDKQFDEFEYRDITWKEDFTLENALLVDYISDAYDSRLKKENEPLEIIFASYKQPMFIIATKQ